MRCFAFRRDRRRSSPPPMCSRDRRASRRPAPWRPGPRRAVGRRLRRHPDGEVDGAGPDDAPDADGGDGRGGDRPGHRPVRRRTGLDSRSDERSPRTGDEPCLPAIAGRAPVDSGTPRRRRASDAARRPWGSGREPRRAQGTGLRGQCRPGDERPRDLVVRQCQRHRSRGRDHGHQAERGAVRDPRAGGPRRRRHRVRGRGRGSARPSSDTPTHLALYRHYAEIGGVVHTHSTRASAWAAGRPAIPVSARRTPTTSAAPFR